MQKEIEYNEKIVIPSKGKSGALLDYKDNFIIPDNIIWPPEEVISKLLKSSKLRYFDHTYHNNLTKDLGFYSDLQSIRSEDAITWSLFGFISHQSIDIQNSFYNELLNYLNLEKDNICEINLWRKFQHPETSNIKKGPEMDVVIMGERYMLLIECKWTSGIGGKQGVKKDKNQIEIRQLWINKFGKKIYPNHQIEVVLVALKNIITQNNLFISWDSFCNFKSIPHIKQFKSYLMWKKKYI
ncbi:MAG: hypothetical protein WCL51_17155 [Bacteroidota bacterium]